MRTKTHARTKARRRSAKPTSCLVRLSLEAKRKLVALQREDETATELVARAIELLRRQRYFEALDESYARMTAEEWASEDEERALWDRTLDDGER